jgi:general L-amino acid transport system substrate-binding protein
MRPSPLLALLAPFLALFLAVTSQPAAAADPTLAIVKQRGQLVCGVNGQLPGFSTVSAQGQWAGLEIDLCDAISAAVLDEKAKPRYVALTAAGRFDALRKGEIDVLVRNTTVSLDRMARTGVRDAGIYYIDGQVVMVPKKLGIASLVGLDKGSVCILKGTPYEKRLRSWFAAHKLSLTTVPFDTQDQMYQAFFAGQCNGVTQDAAALAATVIAAGKASDYQVLPEFIAKDPLGPYVRSGDEDWQDIVRFTIAALIEAEERGITRANIEANLRSDDPAVQLLLGVEPANGKLLGLDEKWAYRAIRQVGNYGECFERNLGNLSALNFARGVNALWSAGGAFYPLPMH